MKTGTLDELVEIEYVPRKNVPKYTAQGWQTVGAAVGTPTKWSVLMIRNHMKPDDNTGV
jgi:hypothetical protein